jgi:hypothetical protein
VPRGSEWLHRSQVDVLAGAVRLFVHLRVGVIALGTRSQSEHDYLPSLPAPFVTATGTWSLRLRPGYSTHVPLTTIGATAARTNSRSKTFALSESNG